MFIENLIEEKKQNTAGDDYYCESLDFLGQTAGRKFRQQSL